MEEELVVFFSLPDTRCNGCVEHVDDVCRQSEKDEDAEVADRESQDLPCSNTPGHVEQRRKDVLRFRVEKEREGQVKVHLSKVDSSMCE